MEANVNSLVCISGSVTLCHSMNFSMITGISVTLVYIKGVSPSSPLQKCNICPSCSLLEPLGQELSRCILEREVGQTCSVVKLKLDAY